MKRNQSLKHLAMPTKPILFPLGFNYKEAAAAESGGGGNGSAVSASTSASTSSSSSSPKCYEEYETHVLIVETATLWMSGVMLPMTGEPGDGQT